MTAIVKDNKFKLRIIY